MIALPLAIGMAALVGCAPPGAEVGGSSNASAGGEGVAAGADAAVYAAALSSVDPITLAFGGHTAGPDNPSGRSYKEYTDIVTERSGGKITFEHDWGGAKVSVDKMADGLGQARIDMGLYAPTYQPEEYPVVALFAGLSSVEHPDPIAGRLATFAARAEFASTWEPLQAEVAAHGIKGFYPIFATTGAVKMHCKGQDAPESLGELRGKRVRISAPSHVGLAEALGMVPVSLTNPELFAALQRGVVDCSISGVTAMVTGGLMDVTDSFMTGAEPGHDWVESPIAWGVSESAWSKLPVAAQQLLWDTQPDMLELQIESGFVGFQDAMEAARERDWGFGNYAPDVTAVMDQYYAQERAQTVAQIEQQGVAPDGEAVLAQYEALVDKWWTILTEELGYPTDATWQGLPADYAPDMADIDVRPFVDRFYQEVLLPQRPA
ncbi:hypothetical protein [Pseudonocardia kunmingensis]|uniref:hypothetical protein n=1 Tax=Pseudonocardia kunmingensis TaxID=630975 RepID=UPI0011541BA3|nr:hypothetical protein [Pseudonocardia kunmingensis]